MGFVAFSLSFAAVRIAVPEQHSCWEVRATRFSAVLSESSAQLSFSSFASRVPFRQFFSDLLSLGAAIFEV